MGLNPQIKIEQEKVSKHAARRKKKKVQQIQQQEEQLQGGPIMDANDPSLDDLWEN